MCEEVEVEVEGEVGVDLGGEEVGEVLVVFESRAWLGDRRRRGVVVQKQV